MIAQAFGDTVSQRPARIEAFHGHLKDHLHFPVGLPQFSAGSFRNILALQYDASGGRIEQPCHHLRHRCLAAAAFADDGHLFYFADGKGHVIDGQKIIPIGSGKILRRCVARNSSSIIYLLNFGTAASSFFV